MFRRPSRSTLTDTLFPYTTLFRSTILNLVPRFHDVDAGRITVDGQDVRDVTLASLRAAIGIVTQEPALFDDTVRANIAYGRPDATEDEIVAAARSRPEERRDGQECVSTCRSRRSPYHSKKNNNY